MVPFLRTNKSYHLSIRCNALVQPKSAFPINQSLAHICGFLESKNDTPWFGSVVAVKIAGLSENRDIDPTDFRDIVDFLTTYDQRIFTMYPDRCSSTSQFRNR